MKIILEFVDLLLRHRGMSVSIFMHLCLFIFLILNFPQCQRKRTPEVVISVDLLPIKQMTNVKNQQSKQKPKPEEKIIDKPKSAEKPIVKEKIIEKKADPKAAVIKEKIKKKEAKKEKLVPIKKAKTPPKNDNKNKKKPKKRLDEYEEMLKNLTENSKNDKEPEKIVKQSSKGPHREHIPLSLSLRDSIKKQLEQCWTPPVGNKDAGKIQVLVDINLKPDGSVANAKISNAGRYSGDHSYQVAADAAIRAVHKCSPLQGLPVGQYISWENIEFNFDPSEMVY